VNDEADCRPDDERGVVVDQKRRARILDNGITTATFVSGNAGGGTLVVTFDPYGHLDPDAPGFGEVVLTAEGFDVVAFQKRQENYYQDLSRDDVHEVLAPLVPRYRRLVFYGCSVGGYAALYFGSIFVADILAISPRVSTHATYCDHLKSSDEHRLRHRHGPIDDDTPLRARNVVLVYDPVLVLERAAVPDIVYMNEHILAAFPNINVRTLRHSGHPSTTPLAETHQLRPVLLQFLASGTVDLSEYRRLKSASPTYLLLLSMWLLNRKRLKWAVSLGEKALHLSPDWYLALYHRACLYLAEGNPAAARQAVLRCVEVTPRAQSPHYHLRLIAAFEEASDDEGALLVIKHAAGLAPEIFPEAARRTVAAKASRLLEKSGDLEEALRWGLEASRLGTPNVHQLHHAAHLAFRLSRWEQCLELQDQAVELQGDIGQLHWLRGLALRNLGRTIEAQGALERALKLKKDPYWMLQLGDLYATCGEPRMARLMIQEASASGALSASLLVHQSKLFLKLGDHEAANEHLQQAASIDPSNTTVQKLLASSQRAVVDGKS
jgi:tetratricopeptide (TPR) repeat protein